MKRRGDADVGNAANYSANALKSRKAVISYIIALAVVLVLCIVLSHFIHVRDSNQMDALNKENTTALEKIQNLQSLNETLTQENDDLYKKNEGLKENIAALTDEKLSLETELSNAEKSKSEIEKQYDELKKTYDELVKSTEKTQENQ